MKKIIFLLLAVTGSFTLFAKTSNVPTASIGDAYSISNPKPKVTVSFEIGRKSRDCAGFGVCKVEVSVEFNRTIQNDRETNAYFTTDDNGKLVIEVDKATMLQATKDNYFSGSEFVVEEDYILSADVANALGVRPGTTIPAGRYNLSDSGTAYIISL